MGKRRILIKSIGILFLATGLFSLFLVPVEFTSFYAFSEGGKFHYEGFGFGSFMFAFIVLNIMAYFVLATSGISVGIGNLSLKRWGYNLSLVIFKTILIIGIAALISFLVSFDLIKILVLYQTLLILMFLLIFLFILPFLLLKFYKNPKTEQLFKNSSSDFEKQSTNNLTIIALNLFWILIFCLLIFLRGAFPFFGYIIFKREGIYLLSTAIFVLLILTYLFYINKYYAKFAMITYYAILFFAFTPTFLKVATNEFFSLLNLPAYELEKVVPAFWIPAGINLGFFFGVLITIQTFLIFRVKNIEIDKTGKEFAAKEKLENVLSAKVQGEAGGRGVWGEFSTPYKFWAKSVRIFTKAHRH